ncbi:MAG: carboxypeptidase-like regulatory domain-containing protein [Planctomycetota bacterium]
MNKPSILLALLLLVVGSLAFLLWSSGDAPDVPPSSAERTDEVAHVEANAAAAGVTAVAPWADTQPAQQSPFDELLRTEAVVQPSGQQLIVQVWQVKKGVPAPDAEVFLLDGFAGPELSDPFAQHWSALAEDRGVRFVADDQGRVALPAVRQSAIVAARLPGMYGFEKIGKEHAEVETITLRPDETVTVRVIDGSGKTVAGVPVGVVQHVPVRDDFELLAAKRKVMEDQMAQAEAYLRDNPAQRETASARVQGLRAQQAELAAVFGELKQAMGDGRGNGNGNGNSSGKDFKGALLKQKNNNPSPTTRPELRAQRRTDQEGLAVFRHFQIDHHDAEKSWPTAQKCRFEAVLLMPLQQPESRAFGHLPMPAEILLELRLPPTGSLALRTVDRDGRPFMHPVHAELRLENDVAVPWSRLQAKKAQNEEALVFPFVGLGLRFTAHCGLDDEDFDWQAPVFGGPIAPDERLVVDLVIAPSEGMLCGRLLDAAGRALGDAKVTFLISGLAGRLEGEELQLDHGGRFHLPYQMRPQHQPPFRLQIRRPGAVPIAGLAMPLASLPREHVTDLGDRRLDGLSVVALGIVVDDRGQPIAGAHLQLQRERNVRPQELRLEFVDEAFASAETDAEGHFALLGDIERARYRLRVEAKEHFPLASADLRPGAPMRVELQRHSRVLGTLLRPEWLAAKGVRAELVLASDGKQKREDQIHDFKGTSYVFFDWVKPGVYDLTLRTSQFPDPFLRIDRLVIEPGQMDVHPRLTGLDLAAWLYRFEIFAVDEQGQAIEPDRPLLARIHRPDGSSSHIGFAWQKGRIEMFSTNAQSEVIPMAQGFAGETAVLAAGRSELRFSRIPPVDVQLAGMQALAGAVSVQVVLEVLDAAGLPQQLEAFDGGSRKIAGSYARAKFTSAMLDEGDAARVPLTRQGPHKVLVRFGVKQIKRPSTVELGAIDVKLQPGSGPQRVVVNYDRQPVQAAIAEAAQAIAASAQSGGK